MESNSLLILEWGLDRIMVNRSLAIICIIFCGLGRVCLPMAIARVYSILSVMRLDNWHPMSLLGRLLKIGALVLKITCLASGYVLSAEKYCIVDSIRDLVEGHP